MKRHLSPKSAVDCTDVPGQTKPGEPQAADQILQSDPSKTWEINPEEISLSPTTIEEDYGGLSEDKNSLKEEIALEKLSYSENDCLIEEYNEAVKAQDWGNINKITWKIVVANMPLIRFIVKPIFDKYQCKNNGIEFDDLMCAGYDGIRRAIRTLDPEKGSLGTYAGWWINCYTTRYIQDTIRTMRLPNYLHDKIQHIRQAEDYFISHGRVNPDNHEIADRLGWDEKEVSKVRKAVHCPTSIDAPKMEDADGSSNLHEHYADKTSLNPEKMVTTKSERQFIRTLLEEDLRMEGGLNKREKIILKLRFGINSGREVIHLRQKNGDKKASLKKMAIEYDGQFKTLEQIGSFFGTTRERIRQIETSALKKFKKLYYNKVIKNIHPSQITTEELEIIKSIHHKKEPPPSFDSAKVFRTLRNKQLG